MLSPEFMLVNMLGRRWEHVELDSEASSERKQTSRQEVSNFISETTEVELNSPEQGPKKT